MGTTEKVKNVIDQGETFSLSNNSTSETTDDLTTELVDSYYTTEKDINDTATKSDFEHKEKKSSATERLDNILHTIDENTTKMEYDMIYEKLEVTEATTETTSTTSPPPPMCITRSGDRKAPYVFSMTPLPPRSHVQYTFITLDMKGKESYQNIALTIRGSKGNGRGGTQFLHTRGGRRGVVTLGP